MQLCAPDDGRGDAQNILSRIWKTVASCWLIYLNSSVVPMPIPTVWTLQHFWRRIKYNSLHSLSPTLSLLTSEGPFPPLLQSKVLLCYRSGVIHNMDCAQRPWHPCCAAKPWNLSICHAMQFGRWVPTSTFQKILLCHIQGSILVSWTKRQQVPPIQCYLTTKPVFPKMFCSRSPFGFEKLPRIHKSFITSIMSVWMIAIQN
jgi:hypothetical protein